MTSSLNVNRVGKYLYRNLEGAEKIAFHSNTCDVYVRVLYQEQGSSEVKDMLIDVSITTYQNKLRVNTIELSPEERTLGFDLYDPELVQDLQTIRSYIWSDVKKRIHKAYKGCEVLF